jgi:hypothetical protein
LREGRADYPSDPGCIAYGDGDETDPEEAPACANGDDDDNDGWADWPGDPGCTAAADDSEHALPGYGWICDDGIDNDRDGDTDYDDTDCAELGYEGAWACSDGLDNDGDGARDWLDPGCDGSYLDNDETDPADPPACSDGLDNDGDGLIDWMNDPECFGDPNWFES